MPTIMRSCTASTRMPRRPMNGGSCSTVTSWPSTATQPGRPGWHRGPLAFDQRLTESDGTFTLVITPLDGERSFLPVNTNGSQRGGRPVVAYLPRRIGPVTILEGGDWHLVVTDDFVLVPLPQADRTEPVTIVFREQTAE